MVVTLASLLLTQWVASADLQLGDRVRVHVLEQDELLGVQLPRLRVAKYSGKLTYFAEDDSLALQSGSSDHGFSWFHVRRLDIASGTNWSGGALQGAKYAFIGALSVAFLCAIAGGEQEGGEGCPFWKNVARIGVVTVPVGALIGSLSPRWKRVYRHQR